MYRIWNSEIVAINCAHEPYSGAQYYLLEIRRIVSWHKIPRPKTARSHLNIEIREFPKPYNVLEQNQVRVWAGPIRQAEKHPRST